MPYTKHSVDGVFTHYSDGMRTIYEDGNRFHVKLIADIADDPTCITEQDDTPVETFSDRMTASDAILSRTEEDLADAITALGGSLPAALATKVADKKLLRSNG